MQWGFRKSVHQNGKLVESTSKYLRNPYILDESAEHRTHHPESEHYSDEQHVQNLHKAFKENAYKVGQIMEYEEDGVKRHLIWTGNNIY